MAAPNVNSTPFRASYAGRREYQQLIENARQAQEEHDRQMRAHWVGPWDPLEFMQKLMPCALSEMKDMPKDVKFELPVRTEPKLEKHIYQLFDKTIKDHALSPNFMFFIGADGRAKGGDVDGKRTLYRPDGGVREIRPAPRDHGYNTRGIEQNLDVEDVKWTEVTSKAFNWHEDSLVVEFKKSHKMDPFFTTEELKGRVDGTVLKDGPEPLLTFAKIREDLDRTRGQLTAYATEVFDHQHRTHIFQLLVCGRRARFIFWDHSGALVSDAFDYTDKSAWLVEFFWRYNHMTPEARGIDVTAQHASVEEQSLFNGRVTQFLKAMNDPKDKQRKLPGAEQTLDPSFPVYKVTVLDESGNSEEVLIRAPFVRSHSALGRATRGYIAYVLSSEKLKFLKDTWRVVHPRLTAERRLYGVLENANVPNVPIGAVGGDVSENGERSLTRCQEWATRLELKVAIDNIRLFHHHRLLQELAYPVGTAPNSYEFVYAFRDCIDAIEAAHDRCQLLHRDISIGNVMIKDLEGKDSNGILADWDHAAMVDGSPYQNFRTGTWQFISVGLLKNPDQPHTIVDDFESLFWALLYGALHNFEHNNEKDSQDFDMEIFDENKEVKRGDRQVRIGGSSKSDALRNMPTLVKFDCEPLTDLVIAIANEFSHYYTCKRNLDDVQDNLENAPARRAPPKRAPVKSARAPPVLPQTPICPPKKDPAAAQKEFDECKKRLSDPITWKSIYDSFLAKVQEGDWPDEDRVAMDRYQPQTTKQKSQKEAKSHLTSCQTGSQLATFDAIMVSFVKTIRQQEEDKAAADEMANQMSDADDELESCVDKRDHKERIDAMETEFPPVSQRSPSVAPSHPPLSDPPSPATESNPDIPAPLPQIQPTSLPSFPHSSLSMLSGHSVGSSRLKRSIDEVALGPSSQSIDPVPKKSRSRARVKAEPSDRQTRSSSRKTVTRPLAGTATVAADTKTEKESRLRRPPRRVQSSDLSVARPRREGLRPRTTRSTIQ